jgi:hypothetical protein
VGVRLNPFYFQVENLGQIALRYEEMAATENLETPLALEAKNGNLMGRLFKRPGH